MSVDLATKSLLHDKLRFLITVSGVAFAVTLVFVQAGLFIGLMDNATLAYPTYFVHLVFVFYVIAYLPYSKLAHLLYRPIAIIHAKNVGRDTAAPAAKAA